MMKTPTTPNKKKHTLNFCNARNLLQRKAWNENQLLLKPTKQNQKKKQNSKKEKTKLLTTTKAIVLPKWVLWFKYPLLFCYLKEKEFWQWNSFQFLVTHKVENKNQQQQQQQQQELT